MTDVECAVPRSVCNIPVPLAVGSLLDVGEIRVVVLVKVQPSVLTGTRRQRDVAFYGKELSFNNILDGDCAIECIKEFTQPTCVIIKHATPCGIASDKNLIQAWKSAYATDIYSPFGGIIAFNREIKEDVSKEISKLKKDGLIKLIDSSISKKEKNQIYSELEGEFVEDLMRKGLELISGESRVETVQNAAVIGGGNGFTVWFKGKYGSHKSIIEIQNDTINRDCDCKIGKPGGLCLHQMAIYLMLISKKILTKEDLPFNVEEKFYSSIQKHPTNQA